MKRRRFWLWGAVLIALAVFVVFFTDLVGIASAFPKLRFNRTRITSAHSVTLEAVRNIYTFNTVEYVHRAVFPYDFLPERFTRESILGPAARAEGSLEEVLSAEQLLNYNAYNLAEDLGMQPLAAGNFVVVTLVLTAGFDLEAIDGDLAITARSEGGLREALVVMPPAIITEILVEDIDGERYPYPEVAMGAEQWRRIAEFVQGQAAGLVEVERLLEVAESNGREFVREVLLRAGYDEVTFVDSVSEQLDAPP